MRFWLACLAVVMEARAEHVETGPHQCAVEWDQSAFWITCDLEGEGLIAPETEDFWNRTSVEAYLGESGRPMKWFCDGEGRVKTEGDMVYPADAVICSVDGQRIETGLLWTATPYKPGIGTVVHYGLKVNAMDATGRLPAHKTPEDLKNDPTTFAALELTGANHRGEPTTPAIPSAPVIPEHGLALVWDPQDNADWFNVWIERDGEALDPIRVAAAAPDTGQNSLALAPYIEDGVGNFRFIVTAGAEELDESAPSDPLETWIIQYAQATGAECPPAPDCPACPACPDCPPEVVCPPLAECPKCPAWPVPQVQSITVECAP